MLLAGRPAPGSAAGPEAAPTDERPFAEIYLPLVMRDVGHPFPTDPPTAPTVTPTATATRRPTITPTATTDGTATPTETATPTATATSTPTPAIISSATPTATTVPNATPTASPTATAPASASATASATPTTATATPTATSTPRATATPSGRVVLLNAHAFTYSVSGQTWLRVVGEVQNQSASNVTDIAVTVNLLRDDLLVLATQNAEVFADRLAPMQTAPFRLDVEPPPGYDSSQSQVTGWTWTDASPLPPVAQPSGTYRSSDGFLFGLVANTTATPIDHTRVVAVYRDARGAVANVVDSGIGTASPYGLVLASGGSTPFRAALTAGDFPGEPGYIVLYEPTLAPAPTPLPITGVRIAPGNGHTEIYGELTNTALTAIDEVQVIGTFLDGEGRVVAVDWAWASENADRILNPGVTAPFVLLLSGPGSAGWTRYAIQTAYHRALQPLPAGATIENPTFTVSLDYRTLTLRGGIVNGTSVSLARPRLVVTFYQQNVVYYVVVANLPEVANLAPGKTAPYVVTAPLPPGIGAGLAGTTASYALDFLPQ